MTISCQQARFQQQGLLADTLSKDQESILVSHLDTCVDCQREIENLTTRGTLWEQATDALRLGGVMQKAFHKELDIDPTVPTRTELERSFRSFLAPTDDPSSLGRIGTMEVTGVIGHGGAGIVYKALDKTLGRSVAIKLLNPSIANQESARTRFAREARAMAAISHDHVVPVYAVSQHNGIPYLVMEYVPGGTLAKRISNDGPLDTIETVRVALQIAQGLAAAHRQGVVHRDVKPSNILLDPGVERVRVADFGLARAADDHTHTESGTLVGTPQYMSPEQVCGEPIDFRSDLYSLGSVMYTCCTGKPPFESDSVYAMMQKISQDQPPSASTSNLQVPVWLDGLIAKLHARRPSDRFESAEQLTTILEAELLHLQQPISQTEPLRPWLPRSSRLFRPSSKASFACAACVLCIAGGLGGWAFWPVVEYAPNPNQSTVIVDDQEASKGSELSPELNAWVERLVQVENHNVMAFRVGPELLKLPASDSLAVATATWPRIQEPTVKTGVLKAFHFGSHPSVLKILHLGMKDADPKVQQYAASYLRGIAMSGFEANSLAYDKWYKQYCDQPLETVFQDAYHRLTLDLQGVEPKIAVQVLASLGDDFGTGRNKSSDPAKVAAVKNSILPNLIVGWVAQNELKDKELEEALRLVKNLPAIYELAESQLLPMLSRDLPLRTQVGVARALVATHPQEATEFLFKSLSGIVTTGSSKDSPLELLECCRAISEMGDPRSIPKLIAIMDCDNSPYTRAQIGPALCESELGKWTKVKDSVFLEGAWWRNWWSKNATNFPEEVRSIEIESLPKTAFGAKYQPRNADLSTHEGRVKVFQEEFAKLGSDDHPNFWSASMALASAGDARAIPVLIGAIEADNSYETVYGVGYFGLGFDKIGKLTKVQYSPFHDGAWWRRWWEANKLNFPEEVQQIAISEFPKTTNGKKHIPIPDDLDTHDGRIRFLTEQLKMPDANLSKLAELIGDAGDLRGIPVLIGVIISDKSGRAIYDVGYFGLSLSKLGKLTGVSYDKSHDTDWWKRWWITHRRDFPDIADMELPTFAIAAPPMQSTSADVEDIPSEDLRIGGDANKRYFLIGDSKGACPDEGFKLAIIMPGGDGGEDFNPFVRRIHKYALGGDWIVAEPVSVYWNNAQEIVWPTQKDAVADSQFSTEEFVGMVIDDVRTRAKIDSKNIVTLTWSSSGPAGYAIALQPETPVTGIYIAMSVFRPEWYTTIASAKDRRFVIDHSPQDRVCPYSMSINAEKKLLEAGAQVKRIEYEGGHGWHGDVYGRISEEMKWLTQTQ